MKDVWIRATVIGSLWAAIEIVIGSFLHNLRIPFAGSLLAFSSVVLLIAFLRIWPYRGMVLRAGLICALMKSISPSAVIIGPMTGIILEAAIIELSLLTFGMNRVAFVVGGMLAVWSALLHKLSTLLLVYGLDFVRILEGLYRYAVRQIGMENASPWLLLLVLSLIYWGIGFLASILGMRLELVASQSKSSGLSADIKAKNLFSFTDAHSYSLVFLGIILLGMIGMLFLMNTADPLIFLPLSLVYLSFLLIRYKRAIRPLTRPKFWLQLAGITLLAAVVIDGLESGIWFSQRGLEAGLLINLRALIVLMGFAALGTELKNPIVKGILYKRGFAELYESLNMAFSTLPALMAILPARVNKIREIPQLAARFLSLADELYVHFDSIRAQMPKVFLIRGNREAGKTTFLSRLQEELQSLGIQAGGFLARGVHMNSQRQGYDLELIPGKQCSTFCRIDGPSTWEKVGRFRVDPEGITLGEGAFDMAVQKSVDVFILDEVGPLEMQDKGWADGICQLTANSSIIQIWSVRNSLVKKVPRKWPLMNYYPINPKAITPEDLAQEIFSFVQQV
ncbi:MAG: nucleoside-triphosphatase [Bacteroidota bacterium]|nr:nucleoside-triphosphatase [Bacteroidota bacterium]